MESMGVISLIPVVVVVIIAILTKRATLSLVLGGIVGFIMLYGHNFLLELMDAWVVVVSEQSWFILVFLFSGALIGILGASGSPLGFTDIGVRVCKNKTLSLLFTWIIGVIIFIDDYLNNLVVATAVKGITDKQRVSRQLLAYVINATGASVCVLVPVSTWAVFMQSLYTEVDLTVNGTGLGAFTASIPYMWYPVISVICALLVIFKVIPLVGPLKKIQKHAETTGDALITTDKLKNISESGVIEKETENKDEKKCGWWNFLIPMVCIIIAAIWKDMLIGLVVGLIVTLLLYIPQKIMTIEQWLDTAITKAGDMLNICALVGAYFVLQKVNDATGMTEWVIAQVEPMMTAAWLPLIAFVVVGLLSFTTASFWGMPAIAFPIIIPIAISCGCSPFMAGAAIIGGAVFGSNACFYGDAAMLVSQTTDISIGEYGKTVTWQMMIPFVITCIVYIIYGMLFA